MPKYPLLSVKGSPALVSSPNAPCRDLTSQYQEYSTWQVIEGSGTPPLIRNIPLSSVLLEEFEIYLKRIQEVNARQTRKRGAAYLSTPSPQEVHPVAHRHRVVQCKVDISNGVC